MPIAQWTRLQDSAVVSDCYPVTVSKPDAEKIVRRTGFAGVHWTPSGELNRAPEEPTVTHRPFA